MRELSSILTPALVLDPSKVRTNIERVQALSQKTGIPVRAHMKTAKSLPVAHMLQEHGVDRFAVSTVAELHHFAQAGFGVLMYTTALTPDKVEPVLAVRRFGADPIAVIDNYEMARMIIPATDHCEAPLKVVLEIDLDGNRCGIRPQSAEFEPLLDALRDAPGIMPAGIMTYSGATYSAASHEARLAVIEHHCAGLNRLAKQLKPWFEGSQMLCSSGGSPMGFLAERLYGLNELRMGVFYFSDLFQAQLGVGDESDIAVSVLSSVMSVQPHNNRAVIDAGGLALSQDRSTAGQNKDWGFGRVCDLAGEAIADLHVASVSQEHGLVTSRSGDHRVGDLLKVADKIRVLPNHVCMTAAAHDRYELTQPDAQGRIQWTRVNGWFPNLEMAA